MDFLLHNTIFDNIITIFLLINSLVTGLLSFKEIRNKKYENEEKEETDNKNIYLFKIITISIWFILIIASTIYFAFKYNFISYFTLFYYFAFIFFTFKIRKKNISDLSYENKMYYIQTTFLYSIFFSNKATTIYLNNFLSISHSIKEYMLIIFLIVKLLFFIFCLIINFSIMISNIKIAFNKPLNFIKRKFEKYINKTFELSFYDFYFSKKNKKMLFIDIIIYVILCPITIIFNLIVPALIIISKILFKKILILGNKLTHYLDNSSKIIIKALKISIIFSLIVVYGIIIYNPDIIASETKDIYNLLITVILIPLIYDSIKLK